MEGKKDYNLYPTERGVYCNIGDTNELTLIENFEQKFGKLLSVHPGMHNCVIHTMKDCEHKIYGWGSNSYNCMGLSETVEEYPEITEFENFYQLYGTPLIIERGLWHTVYYVDTGDSYEVYVCGLNHHYQLGIKESTTKFTKIENFTNLYGEILDVSCGSAETIYRVIKDNEIKFYVCGNIAQKKFDLKGDEGGFKQLQSSIVDLSKISNFLCDNGNYFFYSETTNTLYWCNDSILDDKNLEILDFSEYGEFIQMKKGFLSSFLQTTTGVLQVKDTKFRFKTIIPHVIQYGYYFTSFHFTDSDGYQVYSSYDFESLTEMYPDFVQNYGWPAIIKNME